jgi:hypothetical protein
MLDDDAGGGGDDESASPHARCERVRRFIAQVEVLASVAGGAAPAASPAGRLAALLGACRSSRGKLLDWRGGDALAAACSALSDGGAD